MECLLNKSHRYNTTMLNTDNPQRVFMQPNSCKDYVHDSLTHAIYPDYAKLWHIQNNGTSKPDLDRPSFVVYTGAKSSDKNARKFAFLINQVEERMGIDGRTVSVSNVGGIGDKSAPFVAIAPQFWVRSPIAVSAYLTFLRLSPFMKMGESIDSFLVRQLDKSISKHKDAGYLRVANKNGNIASLFDRSMPALNREGFSDFLLSNHSRGFAWYNDVADRHYPMEEKALISLRVDLRRAEMENNRKYLMDTA